jgi:hypothetical protein
MLMRLRTYLTVIDSLAADVTSTQSEKNQRIGEAIMEINEEIEAIISNLPPGFDRHALQKTVDFGILGDDLFKNRMLEPNQIVLLKDVVEQVKLLTLGNKDMDAYAIGSP